MIQEEIKIKIFEEINALLKLMDKIDDIEIECYKYLNTTDTNKLHINFQNIRERLALCHYYRIDRLNIFKESE